MTTATELFKLLSVGFAAWPEMTVNELVAASYHPHVGEFEPSVVGRAILQLVAEPDRKRAPLPGELKARCETLAIASRPALPAPAKRLTNDSEEYERRHTVKVGKEEREEKRVYSRVTDEAFHEWLDEGEAQGLIVLITPREKGAGVSLRKHYPSWMREDYLKIRGQFRTVYRGD